MSVEDQLIALDPHFAPVIATVGRLDFTALQKGPYVALLGAILGQKIAFIEARKLRSHLYATYGTDFAYTDFLRQPEKWTLLKSQLPADKVAIIENLHRYLDKQPADYLIVSPTDTNGERVKRNIQALTDVYGIGPWTINNCLLVAGLDMDIFLPEDYFLRKRIQKMYDLSKMPMPAECSRYAERWRPLRGYAAWILWRWL